MTQTVENITLGDLDVLEGYIEERTKGPYELKRLRNEQHLLILYRTGKLVIQGEGNPFGKDEEKQEPVPGLKATIGSDETLKGDTFGGLIVCAAYFKDGEIDVRDSKSYNENKLRETAEFLLRKYPDRFASKSLLPQEYNMMYAELGSQTAILNVLHNEVGRELKKDHPVRHVVDHYPGCDAGDISQEKAESSFSSVAAASIVARYYALLQFEELSKQAGFVLPLGSTHVKEAVARVKQEKLGIDKFCKMHFKTVQLV